MAKTTGSHVVSSIPKYWPGFYQERILGLIYRRNRVLFFLLMKTATMKTFHSCAHTAEACEVGHWTMLTNEKEKRDEMLKNDMHKVHFPTLVNKQIWL